MAYSAGRNIGPIAAATDDAHCSVIRNSNLKHQKRIEHAAMIKHDLDMDEENFDVVCSCVDNAQDEENTHDQEIYVGGNISCSDAVWGTFSLHNALDDYIRLTGTQYPSVLHTFIGGSNLAGSLAFRTTCPSPMLIHAP